LGFFEEGSASFLKKRSKKLLVLRALATPSPTPAVSESFLVTFFQKSNGLLPGFSRRRPKAASSFNAGIRALRRDGKLHTLISSYQIPQS